MLSHHFVNRVALHHQACLYVYSVNIIYCKKNILLLCDDKKKFVNFEMKLLMRDRSGKATKRRHANAKFYSSNTNGVEGKLYKQFLKKKGKNFKGTELDFSKLYHVLLRCTKTITLLVIDGNIHLLSITTKKTKRNSSVL